MRQAKTDRETEQLLQELDKLREAAPNADIEPPDLVDQAVRNMARRELQQPPTLPPIAPKLRWIAGLATVSIAMIAVGISLTQTPQATLPTNLPAELQGIELERRREDSAEYPQAAPEAYSTAPAMTKQSAAESEVAVTGSRRQAAESPTMDSMAAASEAAALPDEEADQANLAEAQSAEAWLELILQLHDQGLHTEAQHELQAFERQYPDVPLPDWAVRLLPHQP